jgi:Fe/S biogenesis protein NfuA
MLNITDTAKVKILELMRAENRPGLALRFGVQGRGPQGFQYRLAFVDAAEKTADDTLVDAGDLKVLVDAASIPDLTGATLDYVDRGHESGFKIDNPNPLWRDPMAARVQEVLDREINPAVAMHGGWVALLDVRDGTAYVQLGGGCQGCGMVDVTLKQGIEVRIREMVPEIVGVIDTTDHASGRNPFYQPAKGGRSPYA